MFEEANILWIHAHHVQILFHSLEKEYLLTNLPWLIGSLGKSMQPVENRDTD